MFKENNTQINTPNINQKVNSTKHYMKKIRIITVFNNNKKDRTHSIDIHSCLKLKANISI